MSVPKRRTVRKEPIPKKECVGDNHKGNREKSYQFFFKVDSPMFPDGMINLCRDCVREQVDLDDMDSVIGFLRQIDKPFIQNYWDEAEKSTKHTLGEYIRKINSLPQVSKKNFDSSDGVNGFGKIDLQSTRATSDSVLNLKGESITYSDELVDFWGIGYKKQEYLKMEKFFQDMRFTHNIHTPTHVDLTTQLAYMSIERDRLRQARDWTNYPKISKTIEEMTKSAGFRPVDKQGVDDATGIKSFSQIWEEVEKKGFRLPPLTVFEEDVYDGMIISLLNYYNRIVGKQLLSDLPEEVQLDMDDFYELDETPVDLDDQEYDDMDFSFDDEDELEIGFDIEDKVEEEEKVVDNNE